MPDAGELRGFERGGSGQLPPAGAPSPGVFPSPRAPEVSSTTTSAQATKGSDDTRSPELFCMEDAEATVETLLLMEFADLGTLDQTVTSGKLKGNLVRAQSLICCYQYLPFLASIRSYNDMLMSRSKLRNTFKAHCCCWYARTGCLQLHVSVCRCRVRNATVACLLAIRLQCCVP